MLALDMTQVFLSMPQLFEQLAQRRPLVLVMEDWHWVTNPPSPSLSTSFRSRGITP